MKSKQIIGIVVGALIIFIWQFLSWTALNVHGNETQYTANQDKILEVLGQNLEEGNYFLPTYAPGTSQEEISKMSEAAIGKPWAQIKYRKAFEMNIGMNLFRCMAVDLFVMFLLVWILMKFANPSFMDIFLSTLFVGIIGYGTLPYTDSIWFDGNTISYLIDCFVQWGLVGAWLGWWLNRG